MKIKSIGFIGGGRITKIFLEILSKHTQIFGNIIVSDSNTEVLSKLKEKYPAIEVTDDNSQSIKQDLIILALHPQNIQEGLSGLNELIKPKAILLSLSPKITIDKLTEILGGFNRIVRAIPNSPSIISKGYNPLHFGEVIDPYEESIIKEFFDYFGDHIVVEEKELEAYALISAMGPTYFQFQFNKLYELAREFGLYDREAKLAVKKMVDGINKLMFESDFDYELIEDLIPVKPIKNEEENILKAFDENLSSLYKKLKQ